MSIHLSLICFWDSESVGVVDRNIFNDCSEYAFSLHLVSHSSQHIPFSLPLFCVPYLLFALFLRCLYHHLWFLLLIFVLFTDFNFFGLFQFQVTFHWISKAEVFSFVDIYSLSPFFIFLVYFSCYILEVIVIWCIDDLDVLQLKGN